MVLHGFEGRLMSEPRVFAAAGHRCAATVSSTGESAHTRGPPLHPRGKKWPVCQSGHVPIGAQTTSSPAARVRRGRKEPTPLSRLCMWT